MISVTCVDRTCGVVFGIPEHIETQARRDHERMVHCPNGHRFYYTDSEPEKLRKQIASLEARLATALASRDRYLTLERYWRGRAHRKPMGTR
jgi:hypothetical protein